ncbi:EamA family transporter RarD [Polycladidibacter stylochi]|uniref:EamA family transporter RarD n=1 Tax=Polycladidibacter stylochi TaxID=1807766 RepID=UPI0009EC8ED5|nr:EamA family transporter RarD [Pseudovibrio stylochi]
MPKSGSDTTAAQLQTIAAQQQEKADFKAGVLAALLAYIIWGFAAIYYKLTADFPAMLVICYRILGSVLFVTFYMAYKGQLNALIDIFKNKRLMLQLSLSSAIVTLNWTVFIWAVEVDRVLDASLGYFINPLVTVALGVLVLKERLRYGQILAISISIVAVAYQTYELGKLPWVSLVLAFSFAIYGLIRKQTPVNAIHGQLVEVLLVSPIALFGIAYFYQVGTNAIPLQEPWMLLALLGTGLVTAVPLALFAFGARRMPLSYIGFMQYLAPSIQFLVAIFLFREPLSQQLLWSFALIWLSLIIFSIDSYRSAKARK